MGDADAFRVTVSDPHGIARRAEGSSGSLLVDFDGLARVPPDERLLAASAEEAAQRVAERATDQAAAGAWRVDVTLVSAPGVRVGGVEVQKDGANAWTLTSERWAYEARLARG